jgi:DNA-binding HxlR family transcriptional regulator
MKETEIMVRYTPGECAVAHALEIIEAMAASDYLGAVHQESMRYNELKRRWTVFTTSC